LLIIADRIQRGPATVPASPLFIARAGAAAAATGVGGSGDKSMLSSAAGWLDAAFDGELAHVARAPVTLPRAPPTRQPARLPPARCLRRAGCVGSVLQLLLMLQQLLRGAEMR